MEEIIFGQQDSCVARSGEQKLNAFMSGSRVQVLTPLSDLQYGWK